MAIEMGMSVSEFLARHTSREISELEAYYMLQAEEEREAELKRKAEAGVKGRKR